MESCTSSSDATAPSDISTHPSSDKAVPIAGEVQEPQNDAMQVLLAAVKRRRRSSVFVPPVAETSEGSTLDAASAITTKRRKSINAVRRSSITRRSLCSAPPPVLSISDQVRAVMTSNKTTLPQLLDICIRESVSQLCQDQSSNSLLPALKSVLVLNSEQVSEEVGEQLASEGITTASLLLRGTPLSASQQNNTENAVVNVKESKNLNENRKIDVGKGKRESNTESDKENVAGSRKRKVDVFNENSSKGGEVVPSTEDHDVIHKRRLISEYERKTELLRAEHKAWKLLKVQRKEHHAAAKRCSH
ncbi:hypothetical protein FHG87_019248 [Trinorchestia longiramus]|nr:hypothetical protein FHG87_019248 [Trinorchestia longiramus]